MDGTSLIFAYVEALLNLWPVLILGYVLFNWALGRMARRRNIAGWPLVWVPVMNLWVMGSLMDQYQYVVQGKRRKNRVHLPVLAGCLEALLILGALGLQGRPGLLGAVWATALDVVFVLLAVRFYVGLYRLYVSCKPRWAVALLAWSLGALAAVPLLQASLWGRLGSICAWSLAVPVFLCLLWWLEEGMPRRKANLPQPEAESQEPVTPEERPQAHSPEEPAAQLGAEPEDVPNPQPQDTIIPQEEVNGHE